MERAIPFYLDYFQGEDLTYMTEVIKKHSSLTNDKSYMLGYRESCIDRYEEEIIGITGAKHAIAVHADHSALLIAFKALGLKRNHRVICSIYCHPFIPECIRLFDAEPLFVDIDPDTLSMLPQQCEDLLEQGAKDRIKAIVVSHVGGIVDMEPFYKMKEKYQINIIEDLSCRLGLENSEGIHLGIDYQTDFSIISSFSGFMRKLFSLSALVTSNGDLAKKCRRLRYHSVVRESANNGIFYDITDIASDYNPTVFALHAGLLAAKKNKEVIARRAEIAKRYRDAFQDFDEVRFLSEEMQVAQAFCFAFFERGRDRIARCLFERGIETRLPYTPFNLLSYHQGKSHLKVTQYPKSLEVYQKVLSLPCYLGMSDEDVEYVILSLKKILNGEKL